MEITQSLSNLLDNLSKLAELLTWLSTHLVYRPCWCTSRTGWFMHAHKPSKDDHRHAVELWGSWCLDGRASWGPAPHEVSIRHQCSLTFFWWSWLPLFLSSTSLQPDRRFRRCPNRSLWWAYIYSFLFIYSAAFFESTAHPIFTNFLIL